MLNLLRAETATLRPYWPYEHIARWDYCRSNLLDR